MFKPALNSLFTTAVLFGIWAGAPVSFALDVLPSENEWKCEAQVTGGWSLYRLLELPNDLRAKIFHRGDLKRWQPIQFEEALIKYRELDPNDIFHLENLSIEERLASLEVLSEKYGAPLDLTSIVNSRNSAGPRFRAIRIAKQINNKKWVTEERILANLDTLYGLAMHLHFPKIWSKDVSAQTSRYFNEFIVAQVVSKGLKTQYARMKRLKIPNPSTQLFRKKAVQLMGIPLSALFNKLMWIGGIPGAILPNFRTTTWIKIPDATIEYILENGIEDPRSVELISEIAAQYSRSLKFDAFYGPFKSAWNKAMNLMLIVLFNLQIGGDLVEEFRYIYFPPVLETTSSATGQATYKSVQNSERLALFEAYLKEHPEIAKDTTSEDYLLAKKWILQPE